MVAYLVVKYKNWLTKGFNQGHGVRQGYPLSCHLFNLVGQVLVFSLHDAGFFAWWTEPGDPCSIYADDKVLFVQKQDQLQLILDHIAWVGTFTGLSLNLVKTIAFSHRCVEPMKIAGIMVANKPIKYLGVHLGIGDLSVLNFEKPLHTA